MSNVLKRKVFAQSAVASQSLHLQNIWQQEEQRSNLFYTVFPFNGILCRTLVLLKLYSAFQITAFKLL